MDISFKICGTVPIIIFYDIGLLRGNRFGPCWAHFLRDRGGFGYWLFLWRVKWLVQISCNLGKIPESFSIATIWESLILENSAWCAGFCRAWENLCDTMMTFYEEEL